LNSRERTIAAIEGEDVRPVPYHVHVLQDLISELRKRRGQPDGDVDELLGNDLRWLHFPAGKEPLPGGRWRDDWGVVWSQSESDRGSVVEHPLGSPSTDGLVLPPPPSAEDVAALARECAEYSHRYRVIWIGDLLERAQFLRSMEEVLVDLALHKGFVGELLDVITELILARVEAAAGLDVEAVFLSDDYGSQQGLLMSPAMWRELVAPRLDRIFSAARAAGKKVFLHSCGKVDEIVGELVELGVDVLHPVQPEAVELPEIERRYGDRLTLFGGVSTQWTMASGTPDEVRREVAAVCETCAQGGRFILAPGISLQRDVPWGNVEAFLAAAREWE